MAGWRAVAVIALSCLLVNAAWGQTNDLINQIGSQAAATKNEAATEKTESVPSPEEAKKQLDAQAKDDGSDEDEASWIADKPGIQGAIDTIKSKVSKVAESVSEIANRNYVTPGDITSLETTISNTAASQLKNNKKIKKLETAVAPLSMLSDLAEKTQSKLKSFKGTQGSVLSKVSGVLGNIHKTQEDHDDEIKKAADMAKYASDHVVQVENTQKKVQQRVEVLEHWKSQLEANFEKKLDEMRRELEAKMVQRLEGIHKRIDDVAKDLQQIQVKESQDRKAIQIAQTSQASDHDRVRALETADKDNRANVHQLRQLITRAQETADSVAAHDKDQDKVMDDLKKQMANIMKMLARKTGANAARLTQALAGPQNVDHLNKELGLLKSRVGVLEDRKQGNQDGSRRRLTESDVKRILREEGIDDRDIDNLKKTVDQLRKYVEARTGDKNLGKAIKDSKTNQDSSKNEASLASLQDLAKSLQGQVEGIKRAAKDNKATSDRKIAELEGVIRQLQANLNAQRSSSSSSSSSSSNPSSGSNNAGSGNRNNNAGNNRATGTQQGGHLGGNNDGPHGNGDANPHGPNQGATQRVQVGNPNGGTPQSSGQAPSPNVNRHPGTGRVRAPDGSGSSAAHGDHAHNRGGSVPIGNSGVHQGGLQPVDNQGSMRGGQQAPAGSQGPNQTKNNSNLGKSPPCKLTQTPSRKPGVSRRSTSGVTAEYDLDIQDYNGEVESFKVTVREKMGAQWTEVESREVQMNQDGTSLLTSGLKPNTTYQMEVCACNCVGCGGCSSSNFSTDSDGSPKTL